MSKKLKDSRTIFGYDMTRTIALPAWSSPSLVIEITTSTTALVASLFEV